MTRLILSNNVLYGTATRGGFGGGGTVFRINTNGSNFTNLHNFSNISISIQTNIGGANPEANVIIANDTLYGGTQSGGTSGKGTLYKININGTGFTVLRNFGIEGDGPKSGLVLAGNTLYGTTMFGGDNANGSIFTIRTNGTAFTTLYSFTLIDGAYPEGQPILIGAKLYGTANLGGEPPFGTSGNGVVYSINTNGTGFTVLHRFPEYTSGSITNSDGGVPRALTFSGQMLYGTTGYGGTAGRGTIFAVQINGTSFTNLYNFTDVFEPSYTNSDGAAPEAGLILSGNALFGTASWGGNFANGTIFGLSFAPTVTITRSTTNSVVRWPTNVVGFDYGNYRLQSTTNLMLPIGWDTNLPAPVVVNSQHTVTNPISDTQRFYRLSQ